MQKGLSINLNKYAIKIKYISIKGIRSKNWYIKSGQFD